jgi:hypothetical protein
MESRRESQYKRNGNLIDSILLPKSYLFQGNFSTSFFLNGEGELPVRVQIGLLETIWDELLD